MVRERLSLYASNVEKFLRLSCDNSYINIHNSNNMNKGKQLSLPVMLIILGVIVFYVVFVILFILWLEYF